MFDYYRIARPAEFYNVTSPEAYVGVLLSALRDLKSRYPRMKWPSPRPEPAVSTPEIRQGRWLLKCKCGNYTHYDPEWKMSVCYECAAVYQRVEPPERWQDIEQILMLRPNKDNRNWVGETILELLTENIQHGIGVP